MNTADLSQIFSPQQRRTQGRDSPEEQRTLTSWYSCAGGCPSLRAETAPAVTVRRGIVCCRKAILKVPLLASHLTFPVLC